MLIKKLTLAFLALSAFISQANALTITGSKDIQLNLNPDAPQQRSTSTEPRKTVKLIQFNINPDIKAKMAERLKQSKQPALRSTTTLPTAANATMNGLDVLDQGQHGSCVTFAASAALNATVYREDYISQLCSLVLGNTLEAQKLIPISGWDGSLGEIVLKQMADYGVMSKRIEEAHCGAPSYPTKAKPVNYQIDLALHDQYAERIIEEYQTNPTQEIEAQFKHIYTMGEINDFLTSKQAERSLAKTKQAITEGHRVILGFLIDDGISNDRSGGGSIGSFQKKYDTWVLAPEVKKHVKNPNYFNYGGHEVVVFGFDDNAEVEYTVKVNGKQKTIKEKGVLWIRNSWGDRAGDKGDFYMTYDYFKALSGDASIIIGSNDIAV